jgi:hypothetical protein
VKKMFDQSIRSEGPWDPIRILLFATTALAAAALALPAQGGDAAATGFASFGETVGTEVLNQNRAGNSDGETDIVTAVTDQSVEGSSSSNSITADSVSAGALNIAGAALENARGMVNVTANTGPNSVVQGTLSLTVILND